MKPIYRRPGRRKAPSHVAGHSKAQTPAVSKPRVKAAETHYGAAYGNFICVLCRGRFTGHGNNPWPLAEEGKCCNDCDDIKVVPARMVRLGFNEAHAKHTGELARNIRRKICQEKSEKTR